MRRAKMTKKQIENEYWKLILEKALEEKRESKDFDKDPSARVCEMLIKLLDLEKTSEADSDSHK